MQWIDNPSSMTPDERFSEIAAILAGGETSASGGRRLLSSRRNNARLQLDLGP